MSFYGEKIQHGNTSRAEDGFVSADNHLNHTPRKCTGCRAPEFFSGSPHTPTRYDTVTEFRICIEPAIGKF